MDIVYRVFSLVDYDGAVELWQCCEGIGLSDADSRCNIERFLTRNPGLSFAAFDADVLVGTVMAGHDARRGYLYHLAVHPDYRQLGIGKRLVDECLSALKAIGILKSHLFIFNDNAGGISFWQRLGWTLRDDISVVSRVLERGTC